MENLKRTVQIHCILNNLTTSPAVSNRSNSIYQNSYMVRFWISDFWISKDLAKLLHFVLFDFVRSSGLWELPDKGILGYLQFWVGSLEAVEHGTWNMDRSY